MSRERASDLGERVDLTGLEPGGPGGARTGWTWRGSNRTTIPRGTRVIIDNDSTCAKASAMPGASSYPLRPSRTTGESSPSSTMKGVEHGGAGPAPIANLRDPRGQGGGEDARPNGQHSHQHLPTFHDRPVWTEPPAGSPAGPRRGIVSAFRRTQRRAGVSRSLRRRGCRGPVRSSRPRGRRRPSRARCASGIAGR
jgi:hypothetical protein